MEHKEEGVRFGVGSRGEGGGEGGDGIREGVEAWMGSAAPCTFLLDADGALLFRCEYLGAKKGRDKRPSSLKASAKRT